MPLANRGRLAKAWMWRYKNIRRQVGERRARALESVQTVRGKLNTVQEKMSRVVTAIEVSGRIDAEGHLQLDEPLGTVNPGPVRVILLTYKNDEIDEREWLSAGGIKESRF